MIPEDGKAIVNISNIKNKVSILCCIYEGVDNFLLRKSLQSLLKQTSRDFEIILVKDGRLEKKKEEILEDFIKEIQSFDINVVVISTGSNCLRHGSARTIGIKKCNCEYKLFINSSSLYL